MISYLRPPDMIIYLRANVEDLAERIEKRGRESERGISREYLGELNRAYEGWAERAVKICPVKIIETYDGNGGDPERVAGDAIHAIREQFGLML